MKQFETLKDTDASNYILPSAKFNIRIFTQAEDYSHQVLSEEIYAIISKRL